VERGDELRGLSDRLRQDDQNRAKHERSWLIQGFGENSRMGHRTNRAFVARQFGVFWVYMHCMDDADKGDQEDTQQAYAPGEGVPLCLSGSVQT
jgi:hypothetical protein